MDKRMLVIMNPCSGTKRANKYLTDIVSIFTEAGYECTVLPTMKRGDGTAYARDYADKVDIVTCIGGDGTFNEVVAGVLASGVRVPIGYIPAGSTNDFAKSLGLQTNLLNAARAIIEGTPRALDAGSFNDRNFSYVATFGAFTKASYATPQNIKNALGHLAYILEGITSITSIRSLHMTLEVDGVLYEDDYLFGSISNSTSMGGVLNLKPEMVDMSDGLFEVLLVRKPHDVVELAELVAAVTNQNYDICKSITFLNAKEVRIHGSQSVDWSLDGEYQPGCEEIVVRNCHNVIDLIV